MDAPSGTPSRCATTVSARPPSSPCCGATGCPGLRGCRQVPGHRRHDRRLRLCPPAALRRGRADGILGGGARPVGAARRDLGRRRRAGRPAARRAAACSRARRAARFASSISSPGPSRARVASAGFIAEFRSRGAGCAELAKSRTRAAPVGLRRPCSRCRNIPVAKSGPLPLHSCAPSVSEMAPRSPGSYNYDNTT